MVLSCDELTDDELIVKLRSCFSYAHTMNEAREELRSMRQLEHESVSYTYTNGEEHSTDLQESALKMRGIPMSSRISSHH